MWENLAMCLCIDTGTFKWSFKSINIYTNQSEHFDLMYFIDETTWSDLKINSHVYWIKLQQMLDKITNT